MGYIYETHCHTKESSRCGVTHGADYARFYKKLGFSGFFVTDHFSKGALISENEDITWKEKVDRFCIGYENAKSEGDKIGINVMFGWEFAVGPTHFVTYGLEREWLYDNPNVLELGLKDYADKVHSDGGYIVHAHPFRHVSSGVISIMPNHIDAVETINGANANNTWGNAYAEMLGLPKTAGSDIHDIRTKRNISGVISEVELKTPADYIEELKNNRLKLFDIPTFMLSAIEK